MKILIIHKWLVAGGVERILTNYAKILYTLNHKVDIIIKYNLENDFFKQDLKFYNLDYIFKESDYDSFLLANNLRKKSLLRKLHYEFLKLFYKIKFSRKVKSVIAEYDVIINFSDCLDFLIKDGKINKKTIRWIHSQLDPNPKNIIKSKLVFSKHDLVIAICHDMKEKIINLLSYNEKNIEVLFNPININELEEKSKLIDEKAINLLESPFLLQVSRLCHGKGHFELLDIYKKLKDLGITHKLYFIGDGENKALLEEKIKKLGLENDCLLLGEIKNPYPYFKHADLFVHTSESEGLPTVLLESMALGTPVVAVDCPTGPAEILGRNHEYGYLIDMHDKENFVNTVYHLLNNKDILDSYSKKAIQRSLDFSEEKIAIQLEYLLNKMVNNGLPIPKTLS